MYVTSDGVILCFSEVFLSTVQPWPKHLVIIMDHGNSLSANQLVLAKAIAKHLFNILAEGDMVSLPWKESAVFISSLI